MNFGSGGNMKSKAWKDIWGAGQGIGPIDSTLPAAQLIRRLSDEYVTALDALTSTNRSIRVSALDSDGARHAARRNRQTTVL
jgi:hypothetical protein